MVRGDNFLRKWLIGQDLCPRGLENSTDVDILAELKNGIVLCQLVNTVKENAVADVCIDAASTGKFKALANLRKFVWACQSLGIEENYLFQPTELYSENNYNKVLDCLAALHNMAVDSGKVEKSVPPARHDKMGNGNGNGFNENAAVVQPPVPKPRPGIRKPPVKPAKPARPVRKAVVEYDYEATKTDELRLREGDVITLKKTPEGGWWEGELHGNVGWFPAAYVVENAASRKASVDEQGSVGSPSGRGLGNIARLKESPEVNQEVAEKFVGYRQAVVQDIRKTEADYVAYLNDFIENYLLPLQNVAWLNLSEKEYLFNNFDEILDFQQSFLHELEVCERLQPCDQRLGLSFLDSSEQLSEIYCDYAMLLPSAVVVLENHRDNQDLEMFLKRRGIEISPAILGVSLYFSKPLQRLQKYPVLLEELDRYTLEGDPDKESIKMAINKFYDIVEKVNGAKKLKEQELSLVESKIDGWDASQHVGELVMMIWLLVHPKEKPIEERLFLIYPSVLVILSRSTKPKFKYQVKSKLVLKSLDITNFPDSSSTYMLELINTGNMKSLLVSANTANEKSKFIETLQSCKFSSTPPSTIDSDKGTKSTLRSKIAKLLNKSKGVSGASRTNGSYSSPGSRKASNSDETLDNRTVMEFNSFQMGKTVPLVGSVGHDYTGSGTLVPNTALEEYKSFESLPASVSSLSAKQKQRSLPHMKAAARNARSGPSRVSSRGASDMSAVSATGSHTTLREAHESTDALSETVLRLQKAVETMRAEISSLKRDLSHEVSERKRLEARLRNHL